MQPALILQSITAFREKRFGDAAILKAAALTPASYPAVEAAVSSLDQPLFDVHALTPEAELEVGTLGWHYWQFIHQNQIKPLIISRDVTRTLNRENLAAARYVLLHDIFHVLLGFDTSRCGELAVWPFVSAQRYNPAYSLAARIAKYLYPVLEPSSFKKLMQHYKLGFDAGLKAPCLLSQPIDKYWGSPLGDARTQLGIPPVGN